MYKVQTTIENMNTAENIEACQNCAYLLTKYTLNITSHASLASSPHFFIPISEPPTPSPSLLAFSGSPIKLQRQVSISCLVVCSGSLHSRGLSGNELITG
ncbi:hypothetical protein XENOCAPTIV_017527 [Xenoophorus captivus]|uniref:Uncharacterized protein n=1 Tax=Xenoophorus captivus TaxID=1517983 RepID=A0ABV0QDM2_9TELE